MNNYSFFWGKPTKIIEKLPDLSIEERGLLIKNYKGPWIAGGAAIKFFQTGSFDGAKDIDIFFKSERHFDDWSISFLSLPGTKVIQRPPAYSLSNFVIEYEGFEFNLIAFNFCRTPYETIEDFDFTVCRIFTDGKRIIADKRALDHIRSKTLSFYKKENIKKE